MKLRAVVAGVVSALALAGCSSDPTPPAPTPSAAADVWNPCDGLRAARVAKALGGAVRMQTGTPDVPRCAFVPKTKGRATLNVTYQLFSGGLDAAWATMGGIPGDVTQPTVRGADAARLVVNATKRAVFVTGFLQNGDLIQLVNASDLRPYDAQVLVAATRLVMGDLSAHADEAGVK